jgi:hypothetical protein
MWSARRSPSRTIGLRPAGLVCLGLLLGCLAEEDPPRLCALGLVHGTEENFLAVPASQEASIRPVTASPSPLGFLCTGTLVDDGWVLTARHCYFDGVLRWGMRGDPAAVESTQVIVHPALDLALFQIPRAGGASPIPLVEYGPDDVLLLGDKVLLAGVGRDENSQVGHRRYLAAAVAEIDQESMAFEGRGQAGACFGDSGGPVLIRNTTGHVALAAVLSKGAASCVGRDVAVRISAARDWIRQIVAKSLPGPTDECDAFPSAGLCYRGAALNCRDGALTLEKCPYDRCLPGAACTARPTASCM